MRIGRQHGLVVIQHDGWTSTGRDSEGALRRAFTQSGLTPPDDSTLFAAGQVLDGLLEPESGGQFVEGVQAG